MKFLFNELSNIPKLSWCAVIRKGSEDVEISHGTWVEVNDCFFVEGVWDSPFDEGGFDSGYLMGSGGKIYSDRVKFCTPYHIHERLHLIVQERNIFVSPSLVFILEHANKKLDFGYIPYQVDLLRMLEKNANNVGSIVLENDEALQIYHFRNIEIDRNLNITVKNKNESEDFENFGSYKRFLVEKTENLINNGRSKYRKVSYSPIATISTGYDSVACSAILAETGCKDAVTFRDARSEKRSKQRISDNGRIIGEQLGYTIKECDRKKYLSRKDMPEAEFVACGDLGQDLVISSLENEWRQRMVFVGNHGDRIWNRLGKNVVKDIIRGDAAGCSWTEFKFRVGFIYVPLAYIGCLSHPSLHSISNSEEMAPWCMKTRYDRPIARRIAEERGVERTLFGQTKKAITILLNRNSRLKCQMTTNSLISFEKFYKDYMHYRNPVKQLYYNIMNWYYNITDKLISYPNRVFSVLGISFKIRNLLPDKFSQPPDRPSFLIHWGISIIRKRYHMDMRSKDVQ